MLVASHLQELLQNGPAYNLSTIAHSYLCAGKESVRHKMPSLLSSVWSVSKAAFTYAHLAHLYAGSSAYGGSPPVCSNPALSCHSTASVQDTCCFNSPGGELLQTQFWDTNPPTGPVNSWTVHGLWSAPSTLVHSPRLTFVGLITAMAPMMRTATPAAHIPTSRQSSLPQARQIYSII